MVLHEKLKVGDNFIDRLMSNIKSGLDYEFYISKDKENKEAYPELMKLYKTVSTLECMKDAEEDDDIVLLEYNEIIPISIKKL